MFGWGNIKPSCIFRFICVIAFSGLWSVIAPWAFVCRGWLPQLHLIDTAGCLLRCVCDNLTQNTAWLWDTQILRDTFTPSRPAWWHECEWMYVCVCVWFRWVAHMWLEVISLFCFSNPCGKAGDKCLDTHTDTVSYIKLQLHLIKKITWCMYVRSHGCNLTSCLHHRKPKTSILSSSIRDLIV